MASLCVVGHCGRDAEFRYACADCTERMRRQAREVETYAKIIAVSTAPGRGGNLGDRRPPGYGSRSPVRDDAVVMLDYRSTTSVGGPDDETDPTRSLLGTLWGITRWLRDVQGVPHPRRPPSVTGEILWLLPQIEWCSTQQWVDELADDLDELHRQSRRLAGDAPPKPVGQCLAPACAGKVFAAQVRDPDDPRGAWVEGGRCGSCRATFGWADLIRVHLAEIERVHGPARMLVDRATLSAATGRSVHTIRARCPVAERRHGKPYYDLDEARRALAEIPARSRGRDRLPT